MRKIYFVLSNLFCLLLSSCDYGRESKNVIYQNSFFPWPSGVPYSEVVLSDESFFTCNYDLTYKYCLAFKDGTKVEHEGTYDYKDEEFILYEENNVVSNIYYIRYYQFGEKIMYEDIEYTIIWHAKMI